MAVLRSMLFLACLFPACMAAKPNFLVLFADDLGLNQIQVDTKLYGYTGDNGTISTPNLNKLAQEGIIFQNWYSSFHVCSPSRASMMTGRYSIRAGIGISPAQYAPDAPGPKTDNQVLTAEAVGGLPLNETTFAEQLAKVGYATGAVGKWHLGVRDEYLPTNHGFQHYLGIPFSQDMGRSFWEPGSSHAPFQPTPLPLLNGTTVVAQPANLDTLVEQYVAYAVDFIKTKSAAGQPWVMYLPWNHVHAPNSCSARFCGATPRGPVGDAVHELDWAIGQIMAAVEDAGQANDTLTFFTSDNGAPLNNDADGNLPLRDGKASCWEGGFREPGIAHWPGKIQPGRESMELVSTMDIFVTMLTIADADLPDVTLDGIDLTPVLTSEEGRGHDCIMFYRNAVASNASGELFAVRCGDYKVYWATHDTRQQPYPEGRQDPPLIFDLTADPSESHPLIHTTQQYQEVLANVTRAKMAHLATITPVPDQNGRGSEAQYAICADPNSKSKYPSLMNCTISPASWHPSDICASQACLNANPQFVKQCNAPVPLDFAFLP